MKTKTVLLFLAIVIGTSFLVLNSQQPDNVDGKKQYVYVLKLKNQFLDRENWTEKENKIAAVHFEHLKRLTKKGTVILAGRTLNNDESQFGIVILETSTKKEALELMKSDPAVARGLMTAELFPYRIATKRADY